MAEETDVLTLTVTSSPFLTSATSTSSASTSSASMTASSIAAVLPPCILSVLLTVDGSYFEQSFAQSGVREPLDNPASFGVSPDATTFPGALDDCAEASTCIDY